MIYTDDHSPPHIHALGADGEAKIELGAAAGEPTLLWVRGAMSGASVRHALGEVRREQRRMLEAWRRIHEGDEA